MSAIPSLMAAQAGPIMDLLNGLINYHNNRVVGGAVSDGGTTQATGAGGALNFDIDTTAIVEAVVLGVGHFEGLAAQTDADATAGADTTWTAISGQSVVYAVVLETGAANDTPAIQAIGGTVATTGSQVPPTDAEVDTGITHSNWTRIANVTVNRTGDLTVTVVVDDDVRNSAQGLTVLAVTNAEHAVQP